MTRRHYKNNASVVETTGALTSGDLTVTVSDASTFPTSYPWTAEIDAGTASAEVVEVTAAAGAVFTITRGFDGTAAQAHAANATFAHVAIAADYDEANDHVNSTSNVHGVAGNVVGDTDTQILTNKTIDQPAITDPAITGGMSVAGTAAFTNDTTVAGTATAATSHTTGDETVDGNLSVGGTLAVTGAATIPALSGDVAVSGDISAANYQDTGNVTTAGKVTVVTHVTLVSFILRRIGSVVQFHIQLTLDDVSALGVDGGGNLPNVQVATITDAAFLPVMEAALLSGNTGPVYSAHLSPAGSVTLDATAASSLSDGTGVTLNGTYLAA